MIKGIPWQNVKNWMRSMGTAFPRPMPQERDTTDDEPKSRRVPFDSEFRARIWGNRYQVWELLNGRMMFRPLAHRTPPEPFASKQRERFDRCEFDIWLTQRDRPLRNHLFRQRAKREHRHTVYWWGQYAKMRPSEIQYWSSWHPKRLR